MGNVRLNKVAGGLLVLAVLGYTASVATGNVFVYIVCFLVLAAAILFGLLVLMMNIIWKLLPEDFRKTYEGKRGFFKMIIFFSGLLFYIVGAVIDTTLLFCIRRGGIDDIHSLGLSRFIRLLGIMTTFVFVVFLGWNLIKRSKGETIAAGSVIFILFIALLAFVSSTSLKSDGILQVSSVEKLSTLGYATLVPIENDIEKTGVTQYKPELAFDGLNLYNSQVLPEVYLIDMRGNLVHKWGKEIKGGNSWEHHAELCDNGDLLVIAVDQMLIRLDWDSNIKWKKRMRVHHDICVDKNNKVYAIARRDDLVFWHGIPIPILSDYIAVLSPDGEIEKKVYLYDLVKQQVSLRQIIRIYWEILNPRTMMRIFYYKAKISSTCRRGTAFDIMHTNSIEIMERDINGFCKKGDWLISFRPLNTIMVLAPKKKEVVWSWGRGELNWQHCPALLENGNVLIFDNGVYRGFTRILELDPLAKEIVWEYRSEPPKKFFSAKRGYSQRLPNSNTLITESEKGRVFEITREGKIVWEFYSPNIKMEAGKRESIYRMIRIANPERYTHLREFE